MPGSFVMLRAILYRFYKNGRADEEKYLSYLVRYSYQTAYKVIDSISPLLFIHGFS
jgi:hypothetical protein